VCVRERRSTVHLASLIGPHFAELAGFERLGFPVAPPPIDVVSVLPDLGFRV